MSSSSDGFDQVLIKGNEATAHVANDLVPERTSPDTRQPDGVTWTLPREHGQRTLSGGRRQCVTTAYG